MFIHMCVDKGIYIPSREEMYPNLWRSRPGRIGIKREFIRVLYKLCSP